MTSSTPAPDPDGTEGGPHPGRPEAEPAPDAGRPGASRSRAARTALAAALLCGAVGAALALISAGQTWSTSTAEFAQGQVPVSAEGGDVTGLPSALALVGLAALVAVFAVRRAGRRIVAGLLALCGAAVLASALLGADDTGALSAEAAKTSGLTDSGIGAVEVSAWPYVSAVGGALLLVAGLLALRYGAGWPSMSGSARYERTPLRQRAAARARRVDPDRPEDLWKALDRGEDPTHGTA
ncbi:TIGR02234 family membrane protein [Streptomyces qinglanensis]|uniref:TIGR02234 family membrane protein n=1 Tax=Streptomyces qinglanensis TaxID=943816 RepID=UPI0037886733